MEDDKENYNVWIIKRGEVEEDLNWISFESAFQRFKELFEQNIQNQTDPIAIGMTFSYEVLDVFVYPGNLEFVYQNLPTSNTFLASDQFFTSPRVWLWKQVFDQTLQDRRMQWTSIPVEEFQQEYLPQEIQIDT